MIKEYEYLHGVVFSRLCSVHNNNILIRPYKESGYSAYILNDISGFYIKYSGRRLTPWTFSFTKSHQAEILEMKQAFGEVFIALVCHLDGVAVLNFKELSHLIGNTHSQTELIRISRRRNSMYSVSASNRLVTLKVSKKSCPEKISIFFKVS